MENALWNEKLLLASEIAEDYALEKDIRKASGRKELRCPDPECQHSILRYCHGEIKDAFFAHLNNDSCDYAEFDKENTQIMRTVRRIIYENFKKKGYSVRLEIKILPHHYTQLLFDMSDGRKIAVEIGTQHLSANRIDSLMDDYKKEGIAVKWIVLGNTDTPVRENQTFFLKRYLLNESKNKDLLVVNWDGSEVAQYKTDLQKYEYNGEFFSSENYPGTFTEYATLDDLIFEGDELSFAGFHERYREWLTKKQAAFNKKIIQLEEESHKRMEEIHRQAQEKNQLYRERQEQIRRMQTPPSKPSVSAAPTMIITEIEKPSASPILTYEQRRQEILPRMNQQETQVRDSLGKRWIRCEICGAVDMDDKFGSYGGIGHVNLGICYNCSRRK